MAKASYSMDEVVAPVATPKKASYSMDEVVPPSVDGFMEGTDVKSGHENLMSAPPKKSYSMDEVVAPTLNPGLNVIVDNGFPLQPSELSIPEGALPLPKPPTTTDYAPDPDWIGHAVGVSPIGSIAKLTGRGSGVIPPSPAEGFLGRVVQMALDTGMTMAQLGPILPAGMAAAATGFGGASGLESLAAGESPGKAAYEGAKTTASILVGGKVAAELASPFVSSLARYAAYNLGFTGSLTATNALAKSAEFYAANKDMLHGMDPADATKLIVQAGGKNILDETASNFILSLMLTAKPGLEGKFAKPPTSTPPSTSEPPTGQTPQEVAPELQWIASRQPSMAQTKASARAKLEQEGKDLWDNTLREMGIHDPEAGTFRIPTWEEVKNVPFRLDEIRKLFDDGKIPIYVSQLDKRLEQLQPDSKGEVTKQMVEHIIQAENYSQDMLFGTEVKKFIQESGSKINLGKLLEVVRKDAPQITERVYQEDTTAGEAVGKTYHEYPSVRTPNLSNSKDIVFLSKKVPVTGDTTHFGEAGKDLIVDNRYKAIEDLNKGIISKEEYQSIINNEPSPKGTLGWISTGVGKLADGRSTQVVDEVQSGILQERQRIEKYLKELEAEPPNDEPGLSWADREYIRSKERLEQYPETPFKRPGEFEKIAARRAFMEAARNGTETLSLTVGKTQRARGGEENEGVEKYYDTKLLNAFNSEAKRLGLKASTKSTLSADHSTKPYWSEEMKTSSLEEVHTWTLSPEASYKSMVGGIPAKAQSEIFNWIRGELEARKARKDIAEAKKEFGVGKAFDENVKGPFPWEQEAAKGPGAATPEDINPIEGVTGITMAETSKARETLSLDPRLKPENPTIQSFQDMAMEKLEADPNFAQKTAEDILSRSVEDAPVEISVLKAGMVDAKNEYYRATAHAERLGEQLKDQTLTPEAREDLIRQKDEAEGAVVDRELAWEKLIKASEAAQSKWGLTGRVGQGLMDEQFNLEFPKMKFDAESIKGEALDAAELDTVKRISVKARKNREATDKHEGGKKEVEAETESKEAFSRSSGGKREDKYTVDEAKARLVKEAEAGRSLTEMKDALNELSRALYREGGRDRDQVMGKVHEIVKAVVDPKASYPDVRDAHSGYGISKAPTTDEAKIQISQWNAEHQQLAKIEGMIERAEAPKYTGQRRVPGSVENKRLTKQVNKLMKDLGIKAVDPAKQLKTAMETARTRLWNQIVALDKAVLSGEAIPKAKRKIEYDSEIKTLMLARDALMDHYREMFPRDTTLSSDQLLARATKGMEKMIKEYEKRIATNDFSSFKKESNTPDSIKTEALRAQLEALKAQYKELKKLDPASQASADARALAAYKTRIKNGTADLKEQMANGEIRPRKKTTIVKDAEALNLSLEHNEIKKEWNAFKERLRKQQLSTIRAAAETGIDVIDALRTTKASFDLSAVGRQGAFSSLGHPLIAAKSLKLMFDAANLKPSSFASTSFRQIFRNLSSIETEFKIDQEIKSHPSYKRAIDSGLELTGVGESLHMMEETYMSRLAQHIPGVAMSERAFRTYLNTLRFNTYLQLEKNLVDRGMYSLDRMKAISNLLNVGSGRGDLSSMGRFGHSFGVVTNRILFAPRFTVSRAQLLGGQPFFRGDAVAKKMVAIEYARAAVGRAILLGIGLMAGGKLHVDPRVPGFGSIELGGKWIDFSAGTSQWAVLFGRTIDGIRRMYTGKRSIPIGSLKLVPLEGNILPIVMEPPSAAEAALYNLKGGLAPEVPGRFVRQKFGPPVQVPLDLVTGKNAIGQPTSPLRTLVDAPWPMGWSDVVDIWKEEGIPSNVASSMLSFFGTGVQTREEKPRVVAK